jgi:DNA-binding CsgD family transcriptional regulator
VPRPRPRSGGGLGLRERPQPEIARVLYLSPKTVEGHMTRIFAKLGVSSRAQVAALIAGERIRIG